VDNFLSFGSTQKALKDARKDLHSLFEMKEENPNWVMGFELIDNPMTKTIAISHRQYIETILRRFGMDSSNPQRIPLDPKCALTMDEDAKPEKAYPYRELVGALTWISQISRPDIAFAACYLGQFSANPGPEHWAAAKRVLRYLAGTRNAYLTLGGDSKDPTRLVIYSDADWARDVTNRRSVSGYIVQLGSATVSWSSKKQHTVTTSSTESDYLALSYTAKQGLWIRMFLSQIGVALPSPTVIFGDNTGSISIAKAARHHSQTKHIDVHHHFIQEKVKDKIFTLLHVRTEEQLADICTKPLPFPQFSFLVDHLGITLT
jgi:hypothetical protein